MESDWKAPDEVGVDIIIKGGTVFDPVSDDNTENIEGELNGDELPAGCVAGGFGGPDRGDGVQDAGSDTVQDTGAKHPLGVLGRALESGSSDSPNGGYGDGLNTTISIAKPASEESAEEGAGKIVHRNLYR